MLTPYTLYFTYGINQQIKRPHFNHYRRPYAYVNTSKDIKTQNIHTHLSSSLRVFVSVCACVCVCGFWLRHVAATINLSGTSPGEPLLPLHRRTPRRKLISPKSLQEKRYLQLASQAHQNCRCTMMYQWCKLIYRGDPFLRTCDMILHANGAWNQCTAKMWIEKCFKKV